MDINKKIEPHAPVIEKVFIALIFLSIFFNYLISGYSSFLSPVLLGLKLLLVIFYFLQLVNKKYALIWIGFVLSLLGLLSGKYISKSIYDVSAMIDIFTNCAFGIIVLYKAISLTIKNKNFELLTFIMGFLLAFQPALPFIIVLAKADEVVTFYNFALSFSIGTIIYNDNLWHRYSPDEKNIIKYILVVTLAAVMQASFKYINI